MYGVTHALVVVAPKRLGAEAPNAPAGALTAPKAGVVAPPNSEGALCCPKAAALLAPKREGGLAPKAGAGVLLKLKGLAAVPLAPPKLNAIAKD